MKLVIFVNPTHDNLILELKVRICFRFSAEFSEIFKILNSPLCFDRVLEEVADAAMIVKLSGLLQVTLILTNTNIPLFLSAELYSANN